jgi:hypothetical protein
MSPPRPSKRQVEQRRQERAAIKRQRREARSASVADVEPTTAADVQRVIDDIAALHHRYDVGEIQLEELLSTREQLVEQLHVE